MTGYEHTLIAIACMAISFYIGRRIGDGEGYGAGIQDGIEISVSSVLKSLNVTTDQDIEIEIEELPEDES